MSKSHKKEIIKFSVDAGIINRLGLELVGKSETALSELIKNAYDADALKVTLEFKNATNAGGELVIEDNGVGMNREQLERGFMRLSSTEKVHHPFSSRYNRARAGRKGIGRFAAQRLGSKLFIITQTLQSETALKITIDWDEYELDIDLDQIENVIERVPKIKQEGTVLIIGDLRDAWSDTQIKRVYRHTSELIQPNYISDRAKDAMIANIVDKQFSIVININENGVITTVADEKSMFFDKALAIISGSVDQNGKGSYRIESSALAVDKEDFILKGEFDLLQDVHFKTYYFIYDRENYYNNTISKIDLRAIKELANYSGGIRIYRNGFRVLPYGEPSNDWLGLDNRYNFKSGVMSVPYANRNFFGFVEIIDRGGRNFEETASREGLIENNAFRQLVDFLKDCLQGAKLKIEEQVFKIRESEKKEKIESDKTFETQIDSLEKNVTAILFDIESNNNDPVIKEKINRFGSNFYSLVNELKNRYSSILEEQGMLRVLSGMGLQIGEFAHEISQYFPSINGDLFSLNFLLKDNLKAQQLLNSLSLNLNHFITYSSYFNTAISQNARRDLKPILIGKVVGDFLRTIKPNSERLNLNIEVEVQGSDHYTLPMHPSEWSSILFNLYSNAKKAIRRAEVNGRIKILIGKSERTVYVDFMDNGIGINKEYEHRIFDAFFTTSDPSEFGDELNNEFTGTGLGLKIVRDILETYDGEVSVVPPQKGYKTSIRIEVPSATPKQLDSYGI